MRLNRCETLRDGTQIILRSLEKQDAAAAIWFMTKTTGETDFLLREPGECAMTLAKEEEYIAKMGDNPREAMIGAFVDGELIGLSNVSQVSSRQRARHRARIGISLVKTHWGKGIGSAMMRVLTDLAGQAGYEQVELEVVEGNERAIKLYRKFGFETVGRLPRAMKYRGGRYADLLLMVCDLRASDDLWKMD